MFLEKFDKLYTNLQIFLISLIPFALISGPVIPDILLSLSSFIFIIKVSIKKEIKFFYNQLFIFIILFYIYLIFTSLISQHVIFSLEGSLFYFRFIIFAVLISDILKNSFKKFTFYLLISFLFSFTLLIADSYYQYFNGQNFLGFEYDGDRLSSFFNDEKILGSYLSRLSPVFLGLVLYLYSSSKKVIIISLIYILLLDILVILSGERSSIFYIFFSTLIILILISKWKWYRLIAFLISTIFSILIILSNQNVKERVINKTLDQINLFGNKLNFFSIQHQVIYNTSYKIFLDYPIFGVGVKNFRNFCKLEQYKTYTDEDHSVDGCQTHPHNSYIQLLTETGVFGFLFVITFLYLVLKKLLLQFYYLYFLKKRYLEDYKICFYVAILISLWPIIPTGNFFNNWLNIIYYLPIGFVLSDYKINKKNLKINDLNSIDVFCKKNKINLLQFKCDPNNPESIRTAEKYNFNLVDTRLIFKRKINKKDHIKKNNLKIRIATQKDTPNLLSFTRNMFNKSRYYFDKNFPKKKLNSFYNNWLIKGINSEFDDYVFLLISKNKIVGICTIKESHEDATIGLFGIIKDFQIKKYGSLFLKKIINQLHKDKIENYISIGEKEGAKLILDGRNYKIQGYENGYFVGPTLFDNVTKEMTIYKEEIFGPVLSVVRVKSYEEAIQLVNENAFGNGTSIYTSDGEVSRHFTTNCQIGMVGVNVPIPVPMAFHSFGGWKNSLFGDHAMHGKEGINFFTKLKTVTSRWPKSINVGPEFMMPTN